MVMRQLGLVGATRGWANHIRARQATAPTANPVESAYPFTHAIGGPLDRRARAFVQSVRSASVG